MTPTKAQQIAVLPDYLRKRGLIRATIFDPASTWKMLSLAVVFLWLHYEYLNKLVHVWWTEPDWSHGFIIPLFCLYFLASNYQKLLKVRIKPAYSGIVIVVLGLAMETTAFFLRNDYGVYLGMIALLFGMVLWLGGWQLIKIVWVPILFLIFAVNVPEMIYRNVAYQLQQFAARASVVVLQFLNIHAEMAGELGSADTVISMLDANGYAHQLNVEEACSGMRLLMAFGSLAVAISYLSDRAAWQRVTLIACALPVAILCNLLRVVITGVLYHQGYPEYAQGIFHTFTGLLMLIPAGLMYLGLAKLMDMLVIVDYSEVDEVEVTTKPNHDKVTTANICSAEEGGLSGPAMNHVDKSGRSFPWFRVGVAALLVTIAIFAVLSLYEWIYFVCYGLGSLSPLILGIIYAYKRPGISKMQAGFLAEVRRDEREEWKRLKLMSIDILLWSTFGPFLLILFSRIVITQTVSSVIPALGLMVVSVLCGIWFVAGLVISAIYGTKASNLKKRFRHEGPIKESNAEETDIAHCEDSASDQNLESDLSVDSTNKQNAQADKSRKIPVWRQIVADKHFLACLVIVLLAAGGLEGSIRTLQIKLVKKPAPLRAEFSSLPKQLGSFEAFGRKNPETGEVKIDGILPEDFIHALGTDVYLDRSYQDTQTEQGLTPMVSVFTTYYTGKPVLVPHVPERCQAAVGSVQTGKETFQVKIPGLGLADDTLTVRASIFTGGNPTGATKSFAIIYFFVANGEYFDDWKRVRWHLGNPQAYFWDKYSYYAFFRMTFPQSNDKQQCIATAKKFLKEALPEMVRIWPDWKELNKTP